MHQFPTTFTLTATGLRENSQPSYRTPACLDGTQGYQIRWDRPPVSDDVRGMFPILVQLLRRIIPGTAAYIVPSVLCTETNSRCAGYSDDNGTYVIITTDENLWSVLDTVLHESWHVAEHRLTPHDLTICRAALSNGLPLPAGYYNNPVERVARDFAAWGLHQLSRSLTPPPIPPGPRTAEQIYAEIFAGSYSRQSAHLGLLAAYANDCRQAYSWLATVARRLNEYNSHRRTT